MSDRLLRHIPTGVLYIWQLTYAEREDFEEVETAAENAPEPVKPKRAAKAGLQAPVDDTALNAEASRGMPA